VMAQILGSNRERAIDTIHDCWTMVPSFSCMIWVIKERQDLPRKKDLRSVHTCLQTFSKLRVIPVTCPGQEGNGQWILEHSGM
jgi:hypothetical protein